MITGLNELMFRTGVWAATTYDESYLAPRMDEGLQAHYTTQGVRVDPQNVFVSSFGYFAGAAVINAISNLAVLCLFYGWWNAKRTVSFSPLELAKVR
jgi:hypothetical protein